MKSLALLLSLAALTSCVARQPVISDIAQDRVRIQIERDVLTKEVPPQQVQAEADRACGIYGRIASQQISIRCIDRDAFGYCLRQEALYACAPADGVD